MIYFFSRIASANKLKQAWSVLMTKFQGDAKVKVVKLHSLRHEFRTLVVKTGEIITDFLSRTMFIITQMSTYGELIIDQTNKEKVLSSLTSKFDHVVAAIEE